MSFEEMDITQLPVGARVAGFYRGQDVRTVPAFGDQPEAILARVFLDADGGPIVVQLDDRAIAQLAALGVPTAIASSSAETPRTTT